MKTSSFSNLVILGGGFIFIAMAAAAGAPAAAADAKAKKIRPTVSWPSKLAQDQRIDMLIKAGVPGLAAGIMDLNEPDERDINAWMEWQRRRIDILIQKGDWEAVANHAVQHPGSVPWAFRREMLVLAGDAYLQLENGAAARSVLRELLWSKEQDRVQRSRWRRMLIRSYLIDGLVDDARVAMIRYQLEYRPNDREWNYLYAEVLLKANDAAGAIEQIAAVQTHTGKFLTLTARLRTGDFKAGEVIKKAKELFKYSDDKPFLNTRIWALLAEAAQLEGRRELRVKSLEKLLNQKALTDRMFLFDYQVKDLWEAYKALALYIAKRSKLRKGKYASWLKYADKIGKKQPYKARAIYAFVATSKDSKSFEKGHRKLVASLVKSKRNELALELYTDKNYFSDLRQLPNQLRYLLSEKALKLGDVKRAAELVENLEQPPKDREKHDWYLRRARLAIYAGNVEKGITLLSRLMEETATLEPEMADRVIQVLFDLQSVKAADEAFRLFDRLYAKLQSKKQQREVLYWMAESKSASQEHATAAEFYLRSAVFEELGYDLWGQTSRYRAAESMTAAGYIEDARILYNDLLRVTSDTRRKVLLGRKIQELWLMETKGGPLFSIGFDQ